MFLPAVKKRYCCIIQPVWPGQPRLLVFWDIFITPARTRQGLASPSVSIIKPELGCNRKVLLHYTVTEPLNIHPVSSAVTIYYISLLIDMINWSIYRITFSYCCNNHENVWIFCITNKTYIRHNITRHNRTEPLHIHLQIVHHKQWLRGWMRQSRQQTRPPGRKYSNDPVR